MNKINIILFLFIILLYLYEYYELFNKNYIKTQINENNHKFENNNKVDEFISNDKCYLSVREPNIKIIHFIITRFLVDLAQNTLKNILYTKDYIMNGIRLLKNNLIPSLERQNCKNFSFILIVGSKVNISFIKSLIGFNNSFPTYIIFQNELKAFIRSSTKLFDVLITTRIDYDDLIYFDAVNDVRKAINIHKPMLLYGYNSGVFYFESNKKFYEYYALNKYGALGIFLSLIINLKYVNDSYTIYDMGAHNHVARNLLNKYKSFGIKELNYEPFIYDSGDFKFVYVRQKFSNNYNGTFKIMKIKKSIQFNLTKFFKNSFYF